MVSETGTLLNTSSSITVKLRARQEITWTFQFVTALHLHPIFCPRNPLVAGYAAVSRTENQLNLQHIFDRNCPSYFLPSPKGKSDSRVRNTHPTKLSLTAIPTKRYKYLITIFSLKKTRKNSVRH